MDNFISTFNIVLEAINDVLWHEAALYAILGCGILFTLWSGFSQFRALTHGVGITAGKYDDPNDPGAINHFQALSTALSATVGIGNIGGVATAVALGGPGAVFWMWVVGFFGMALKTTEVTLAMLYRNTEDPENPHGGAMWVADKGFAELFPNVHWLGKLLAGLFCITLLIATITGGNMFQAFNVAEVTATNFPGLQDHLNALGGSENGSFLNVKLATGIVLSIFTALVVIGGIKRIGHVAAALVPFMCGIYLIASLYVIIVHLGDIPALLGSIFAAAFAPAEAQGAFLGGAAGSAFAWGMKRALFSNEAGQGSAPIAHSAAKTDEPVREGLVAGLEPFIDTIVVCTLTALVILASGVWNREAVTTLPADTGIVAAKPAASASNQPAPAAAGWTVSVLELPAKASGEPWIERESLFVIVDSPEHGELRRLTGTVKFAGDKAMVEWEAFDTKERPTLKGNEVFGNYIGAALTSQAFDRVVPGMGTWMVSLAVWLFAFSTIISWNYYGEQGSLYLFGARSILWYRLFYCVCVVIACSGFITTDRELDNLTNLGTGVMLAANLPILLIFGRRTMGAYHEYLRRF
ncbi:MAG: alanine/glycine:cation symporter family protein, partial [Gemmataceae bacterium]